jgi:hypothetical protein
MLLKDSNTARYAIKPASKKIPLNARNFGRQIIHLLVHFKNENSIRELYFKLTKEDL